MKCCCNIFCVLFFLSGLSVTNPVFAQANKSGGYQVRYHFAGKDTSFNSASTGLRQSFDDDGSRFKYISNIPGLLAARGYPLANVDSSWQVENAIHILLFIGDKYNWIKLDVDSVEQEALQSTGYVQRKFTQQVFNPIALQSLQEKMLDYYEKHGYPFASVSLDHIMIQNDSMSARLMVDKSIRYHVDSIHVAGPLKISRKFLQRYLDIENGSLYDASRLKQIDKRIAELGFVKSIQPADVSLLGAGAVVNIYAEPKKSSQVDAIVGFLPAAGLEKKLQVTADVLLDLQNLLGNGENILVKWQQLQPKSPRLNLGFTYPYIFNSKFGINFLFDLFKKDSSFLQLNALAGLKFDVTQNQTGKLFLEWQSASLLEGGVDTNRVKLEKKLPLNIDVTAVNAGVNYNYNNTDFRLNPRKGNELAIELVTGIKTIEKNNDIINIKDNSYNYARLYDSLKLKSYQLRITANAAHYFNISGLSVLKTALNGGYYNSPSIFRNELYQVGGYRLLRGFDEQSIYATRYLVGTVEYRYLIGANSFLFTFLDLGVAAAKYQEVNNSNQYGGLGLGIRFETRAGLLNLSYAAGKRSDVPFNLREASKLHFGYINYF